VFVWSVIRKLGFAYEPTGATSGCAVFRNKPVGWPPLTSQTPACRWPILSNSACQRWSRRGSETEPREIGGRQLRATHTFKISW